MDGDGLQALAGAVRRQLVAVDLLVDEHQRLVPRREQAVFFPNPEVDAAGQGKTAQSWLEMAKQLF